MSGGFYEYAYRRLDELDRWVALLENMAARCRAWAGSDRAQTKSVKRADAPIYDVVPATAWDRAHITERAVLLEGAARKLQAAIVDVQALEGVMHDVEWVASGDYGVDSLMRSPHGAVDVERRDATHGPCPWACCALCSH